MPTSTVASWRELDDAITRASRPSSPRHAHSTLVFRGLARTNYSHVSSLARLEGDYAALERHLVRNFRKYAHRHTPGPTMWDWLALGQHHGLPTRLLDWTFSPLVALHFATASWPEDDALLLAVDCEGAHQLLPSALRAVVEREGALLFTTEMLADEAPDLDRFDRLTQREPFVAFFEPPSLDERIVNQSAVLSALSDPSWHMEEWLDRHRELWHAWCIPAEVKLEVRERLDQANVTERVLLPGLDGLAAWLRRYYSPGVSERVDADGGSSMDGSGTASGQQEGSMAASPAGG
ncbi:FRG domain-containing protein [Conexibacter sp. SYSU D00693]|uniref:FRG domain-containing protein n=1 Tax=Conexibacter sp. SYSU D00693 TaxID=2812560 RepID=UPI00196B535E|nr:FRG domain-containing protein [Conexibacter sp. SYSU D00693]